jgi:pyruvate,water dikinase
VRIIRDPAQLRDVEEGDVVVAASASSLWVTGFWTAGALVTEAGGLLSHAAIVAREMGMPAVMGVQDATDLLMAGEIVTVDGGAGTVRRQKPT